MTKIPLPKCVCVLKWHNFFEGDLNPETHGGHTYFGGGYLNEGVLRL